MKRLANSKYLQDPEVLLLMEVLEKYRSTNERDCLLIELALKTGARASELLAITNDDLNPHLKSVQIIGLKGSFTRDVPLKPELFKRLQSYAKGKQGRIFPISYKRFQQVWHEYRPVEKSLHSLRHTFGVKMWLKTKDLQKVRNYLGHVSIANTMIYATVPNSPEEYTKDAL